MGFKDAMTNINTLYRAAKFRDPHKMKAYSEAINQLLDSDPAGYLANVEYIISSDYGLATLKSFRENYKMPLVGYRLIREATEHILEKTKNSEIVDSKPYEQLHQEADEMIIKHQRLMAMYEAYEYESSTDEFLEQFYKGPENAYGLVNRHGLIIIPDLLLEAVYPTESTRGNSGNLLDDIITIVESSIVFSSPETIQWVVEASKDLPEKDQEKFQGITEKSLEGIIKSKRLKNAILHKESVMMEDDTILLEYTEDEIESIEKLITFKEYLVTALESVELIEEAQSDVYEAYDELDGLIPEEEACADVAAFLPGPGNKVIEEEATSHKAKGTMPTYLRKHHAMGYGEDEPEKKPKEPKEDDTDLSTSIEDYRRSDISPKNSSNDDSSDGDKKHTTNNYYTNYWNDHSSKITDNSSRHDNRVTDNSVRSDNRDSSTKTDNSVNTNSKNKNSKINDKDDVKKESAPWELNIPGVPDYLTETIDTPIATEDDGYLVLVERGSEDDIAIDKILKKMKSLRKEIMDIIKPAIKEAVKKDNKGKGILASRVQHPMISGFFGDGNGGTFTDLLMKRTIAKNLNTLESNSGKTWNEVCIMIKVEISSTTSSNENQCFNLYRKTIESSLQDLVNRGIISFRKEYVVVVSLTYAHYSIYINKDYLKKGIDLKSLLSTNFSEEALDDSYEGEPYGERESQDQEIEDGMVDDPLKPKSDHPIRDRLQDADRVISRGGAATKKKVNDAINVGKVAVKPIKRTSGWINNLVNRFRDAKETKVKEDLADPRARSNLYSAIKKCILGGALFKAGILTNPIFMFLAITRKIGKKGKESRIRNEMVGELKQELEILDVKIQDADRAGDNAAKYKMMRFKTELEKKLIRVGGGKSAVARAI